MPDKIQPKKPVSDRRRQQNVRAQKNYRERQKRHMQTLEALLTGPGNFARDQSGIVERRCLASSPGALTTIKSSQVSRDALSLMNVSNSLEALNLLTNNTADTDDDTRARVESGEITIGDILKAGLDTLSQRPRQAKLARAESSSYGACIPGLRTDKILVPNNSMKVHPDSLPDIYTNNLRWKQFSTVAAIRANAESIGLTFEEITHPQTMSPFFAATTSTTGTGSLVPNEHTQKNALSIGFQEIKPHLRPTQTQLSFPHHAWLDIFPCPIFRDRYIQLVAMGPTIFSADEFCTDLQNGGLICWGSHSGDHHDASGSGAPWDLRSWEAQPWFLKKWWFVLGGEEGGLFQQSRWWHEIRGDQMPYFW